MSDLPSSGLNNTLALDPALSGQAFLDACVRGMALELGAIRVIVGELTDYGSRARTIASYSTWPGEDSSTDGIDAQANIGGTACEDPLLSEGPVLIAAADCAGIATAPAEAGDCHYAALALRSNDQPIGMLCVLFTALDQAERVMHCMSTWSERLRTEVSKLLMSRDLAEATSWIDRHSDDLFVHMTRSMCRAFCLTTAFVSRWDSPDGASFTVRAFTHEGEEPAAFQGAQIPSRGAPCEALANRRTMLVAQHLQERFPAVEFFQTLSLESYLAVTLRNRDGECLGHIALLHSRPLSQRLLNSPLLKLFASRATAELMHERHAQAQREMETALVTAQKLDSVGLMAGAIAHDFNNLLHTILGSASLAMQVPRLDTEARSNIERIQVAATSAGDLVSVLLDYAGRRPSQRRDEDANAVVADSLELAAISIGDAVRVEQHLIDQPTPVTVDRSQLQQVLVNVILNAAESIDDTGTVQVTTSVGRFSLDQTGQVVVGRELAPFDCVTIRVRDDGRGIAPDKLQRIFDPFFTDKANGRGLGLAVVQGIIRSHGAALAVASKPGDGTNFSIHLPLGNHAPDTQQVAEVPTQFRGTVLVVDDEPAVLKVAAAMLASLGLDPETCASGAQSLEMVSHSQPDYVLLDIMMPGLDGWETLAALRSLAPEVPVVMMSGYTNARVEDHITEYPFTSFLPKPFATTDLARALAHASAPPR
ncbi:MAG: ATP-binding protein [Pseudomonadota bacterium]